MTAPQRSPEWFAARVGRVTGSNVGAILNLDPYRTRADVLRAMVRAKHGAETEFTGNVATQWGTAMEPQARADYEMDACQDAIDVGFLTYDDWLGASPDALVVDGKGVLEIKCPYGIRNDQPPTFKPLAEQPHYAAQVQIEMLCAGASFAHFYSWTPFGQKLETVFPDPDWLATNIPALRQFHAEYLDEIDNPAHLKPLRHEIDTPQAHKMIAEYDQLSEAIGNAEERRKELLAEIVSLADGKDALVAGRKLTSVVREGSVAYAKIVKAKLPDLDVSPWRGAGSSYWRLT